MNTPVFRGPFFPVQHLISTSFEGELALPSRGESPSLLGQRMASLELRAPGRQQEAGAGQQNYWDSSSSSMAGDVCCVCLQEMQPVTKPKARRKEDPRLRTRRSKTSL